MVFMVLTGPLPIAAEHPKRELSRQWELRGRTMHGDSLSQPYEQLESSLGVLRDPRGPPQKSSVFFDEC